MAPSGGRAPDPSGRAPGAGEGARAPRRLVCSAPARANLLGNPTDLYGGAVLACSVPARARVEIEAATRLEVQGDGQELVLGASPDLTPRGDVFDLARVALASVGTSGLCGRIRFETRIPRQGGLGGSSALLVALLHALGRWRGRALSGHALAETARRVELERLGVVCGYVDHYMCVFGGLRYLDFRGKACGRVGGEEPLATVESLAEAAPALPFVLGTTGVRHLSGAVHAPIRERWLAGESDVVAGYERVVELAGLGKRALLAGDWEQLGRLMNENHAIQRSFGGSGESNERLIAAALAAGALGAKLAGAGQGGTVVALCPDAGVECVEAALREAGASTCRPQVVPGVRIDEVD